MVDVLLGMTDTLAILVVTAAACSVIGVFLVLRNMSMMADAISHSAVLGIGIAALFVRDIGSPFLILGAGLFGLLTVFSIETLVKSGLVKGDGAVGIIFPLFFSLGIILISKFIRNMHLDVNCILMGEILFVAYAKTNIFGIQVSTAFLKMGGMFLINLAFIIVFFKELKLNTFDAEYAQLSGFSAGFLTYSLMGLVSVTTVTAFDVVGAILVIAFMIAPPASAYLLTKKLKHTIALSVIIAVVDSIIGYVISIYLNLSMSGVTAAVMGIVFLIIVLFNKEGYVSQVMQRRQNREDLRNFFILLHLQSHREDVEYGLNSMYKHLNKSKEDMTKICNKLIKKNLIRVNDDKKIYEITSRGVLHYNKLKKAYEG